MKRVLEESKKAGAAAVIIAEFDLDKKGRILDRIKKAGFAIDEKTLGTGTLSWTTQPDLEWFVYRDARIPDLFDYAKSIGLLPFSQTIKAAMHVISKKSD